MRVGGGPRSLGPPHSSAASAERPGVRPSELEIIAGRGSYGQLARVRERIRPRRVLIVASRSALDRTAITERFADVATRTFGQFRPNPDLVEICRGCEVREDFRPDLIVGVGGGSAMDVAKAVAVLPTDPGDAAFALTNPGYEPRRRPGLVLIPTTPGTGAEVTRFATIYVDGQKHSLDHERVRADFAVVDPGLTATCAPEVVTSCAWDALAHALESLWSVRSTTHSRWLAASAAAGLVAVLGTPGGLREAAGRAELSRLATMAGLAIDLTRTTLAHAFAYPLTTRFGIRHGVACALNLVWVFAAASERYREYCVDPRGAAFVGDRIRQVADLLGATSSQGIAAALTGLMETTGVDTRLRAHGIRPEDLPAIVADGTRHERAGNSPVALADHALAGLTQRL